MLGSAWQTSKRPSRWRRAGGSGRQCVRACNSSALLVTPAQQRVLQREAALAHVSVRVRQAVTVHAAQLDAAVP